MRETAKLVAAGVIVKKVGGSWKILTQRRKVSMPAYDPLYDGTYECIGETLDYADEPYTFALFRGIEEECGVVPDTAIVYGADFKPLGPEGVSTRPEDEYITFTPLLFTQSVGEPQPWHSHGFMVEVAPNWEPRYEDGDGEAHNPRWWNPSGLREEMEIDNSQFMGLHFALLYKVASHLEGHTDL